MFVCMIVMNILDLRAQMAYASTAGHYTGSQQVIEQDTRISLQVNDELLGKVLEKIEAQTPFVFVYSNDEIKAGQKVTLTVKDQQLDDQKRIVRCADVFDVEVHLVWDDAQLAASALPHELAAVGYAAPGRRLRCGNIVQGH